jgi:predicted porin
MKRMAMSGFAVAALAAASTAQAQSSVTLYGMLDESIAYYNNVGHASLVALQPSNLQTNQWGMKGTEDLGGGWQANFNLGSGFDPTTGKSKQGGRIFGKNAWLGIASNSLGEFRVGLQLDTTVDLVQPLTADSYGPAFTTPGDADNNDNTFRVQNAIKYLSPSYAGLQYELLYALGGVAGNSSSQETSSASVAYTHSALSLAAGYVFAKNDGPGGVGTAYQTANNSVTPLFGSTPFVGSRLISQVAAQYVIGALTANIRYSNAQWKPYEQFAAYTRTETFNTGATSVSYQITPALQANLGYTYTRSSGASSATYNTVALGADYFLSKRTTLYANGGYSHAHGTTFSADGNSIVAAGGSVGDLESSSSTPNQVALMMGIVHKF